MPLENFIPVIDNRTFDDIVAEAKTRIPRYTPEWTDFNDSDPGMTLVQLFAWMADMMIFRLGRVPELNYLKFLQLMGIELSPAEPAGAEVTFPVLPTASQSYLVVPARTPVSADAADGSGKPVVFETERALFAFRAQLVAVQVYDGYTFLDVSTSNEEAEDGFQPFGPLAPQNSALMLGFSDPDPFPVSIELNLTFSTVEESTANTTVSCALPTTSAFSSSRLSWEYWSGTQWRTMNLLKDDTLTLLRSGHVFLKTPGKGAIGKGVLGVIPESLYWIRVRVLRPDYDRIPSLLAVRTNTVPVIQAETVQDEVLGGSNGSPSQVFRVANTPVLDGTLVVEIDEGDGPAVWTLVNDFFASTKNDRHYTLNRTTGEIRTGDGSHGAIPVANPDNANANVIARFYRFGGGKQGNVPAKAISTPLISIAGMDDNGLQNLLAAFGGTDEETLEAAKLRAPATLKAGCRAVTAEDYEELAKRAGNVRRAKALPLYHPSFPGVSVPGVVTVVVVPDNDEPNPMPSEGTLQTVCAYLNERRLLTAELYVIPPRYMEVSVRAEVIAQIQADPAEVKTSIEQALLDYFHPLKGGEDAQGWPFGADIFFSRVYQHILSVPGVERVERVAVSVDEEEQPGCKDTPIPAATLLFSTAHEVIVNFAFEG